MFYGISISKIHIGFHLPVQVETLSGDRLREIVAEYTPIPEKLAAV